MTKEYQEASNELLIVRFHSFCPNTHIRQSHPFSHSAPVTDPEHFTYFPSNSPKSRTPSLVSPQRATRAQARSSPPRHRRSKPVRPAATNNRLLYNSPLFGTRRSFCCRISLIPRFLCRRAAGAWRSGLFCTKMICVEGVEVFGGGGGRGESEEGGEECGDGRVFFMHINGSLFWLSVFYPLCASTVGSFSVTGCVLGTYKIWGKDPNLSD